MMASRTAVAQLIGDAYYRGADDERARLRRRARSEGLAFAATGAALAVVGRTLCDILRDYPRSGRVALGWAFAAWWTAHIWKDKVTGDGTLGT